MTTKSRLWSKIPLTIFHCVLSAWGHSILRGWAQWGQNLYKAELIFSKSSKFMRYVQLLFCSEIQYKPLKSGVVICLIFEKLWWSLQKNITFSERKSKWMLNSSRNPIKAPIRKVANFAFHRKAVKIGTKYTIFLQIVSALE